MRQKGIAGLVVVALVAALTSAAPPKSDSPKSAKADSTDFTGKIVAVTAKDPVKGAYLDGVHVERLGDRAFLVGRYVKRSDDDALPEMIYWLPVDDLLALTVFNSREDALKAYETKERSEKK
jgi:hypothetical protein